MAERIKLTEANKTGLPAVMRTKHSKHDSRSSLLSSHVVRKPFKYSARDVEVVLSALWGMFTQSQAKKLVVSVPWDDSDEPQQMRLVELVVIMESWLEEPEEREKYADAS